MNEVGCGPDVELRGVDKSYGSLVALRAVDMRIERGEAVAILGPNGAGKTTAISLMLGMRSPTAGSVRLARGSSQLGCSLMRPLVLSKEGGQRESGGPGQAKAKL